MRVTFALPMILACAVAVPALAQPAAKPADPPAAAPKADPAAAQRAKEQEDQAAAALAISIRHREAEEQRIAQIACAAGDTSKCPAVTQLANAPTTPRTPSP